MSTVLGGRLRQARIASGMSLQELTERLGRAGEPLTRAALSNYEHGKRMPKARTIRTLAKVLCVTASHLLSEQEIEVRWLAYRSQSRLSKSKKEEIQAAAVLMVEKNMHLLNILQPRNEAKVTPRVIIDYAEAEARAEQLRTAWKLGTDPIDSLTRTIEDHGGIVVSQSMPAKLADGISGWASDRFPVIVVNSNMPDDRKRFSMAHELGHLLMDAGETGLDPEKAAHRFAGAFLAPRGAIERELGAKRRDISVQELGMLKEKYGMSMRALLFRALHLNIISQYRFTSLQKLFSLNGWNQTEPFSYTGDERPRWLLQMTVRALSEGIITESKAAELCPEALRALRPVQNEPRETPSARELLRMPGEQRELHLAEAVKAAASTYPTDSELQEFRNLEEDGWNE